jgi:hypothetical protein
MYITAHKLHLNKLPHASTHTSGIRLLSPHQVDFHLYMAYMLHAPAKQNPGWRWLACLNFLLFYWLPEFPTNSWPTEASTCQCCQMQTHVGHRTARIGFLPPVQSFGDRDRDLVVGTDWLQSLHHGRNTTPPHHALASFCLVKLVEMTLEIKLYELTTPFECCILEAEQMETWGSCLRFWYRKCIKWAKKLFCH